MNDVYCHPLDRAERGTAALFPLLTLLNGGAAAWTVIVLTSPVTLFVLLYFEAYQSIFMYFLPTFLFTLPIVVFSYLTYATTIVHLNRTACWILTAVWGLLFVAQVAAFAHGVLRHSDPTSAVLSACAFAGAALVSWAALSGLFRLARLPDLDRALLCAPFEGIVNKTAFRYFCGMPPIIKFVRGFGGAKARLLILASSAFFSIALSTWPFFLIEMGNSMDPIHQLWLLAKTLIVTSLLAVAANWLLHRGQRSIRFSIEEITAVDRRAPLLFLRAFRDDQVTLPSPRYTLLGRLLALAKPRQSLDHILLTEGTLYGPMVALGNPGDAMPPYGAARGYVGNEHWQDAVTQLARSSLAIVIAVDDTDAIWWEIEHLVGHDHLDKTLFLIHPKFRGASENRRITGRILATLSLPQELERRALETFQSGDAVGFFFDRDRTLCIGTSRLSGSSSYELAIRWFLRHKFGFGVAVEAGHEQASRRAA